MKTIGFAAALLATLSLGCGDKDKDQPPAETAETTPPPPETETETEKPAAARTAVAELQSAPGKEVSGVITFTDKDGQVEVAAQVKGLTPGEHGFHIHETGDCSGDDFKAAGGHFDPRGHEHGAPEDEAQHAGDFGNLMADDQGNATKKMTVDYISLTEGEAAVVGKAVIVHEGKDDLKSQPSGDAGARVACGIIELAEPAGAQPAGATDPSGAAPATE